MAESTIEWTDTTWNPTTGCDRVSAGCDHCYALTMAGRLKGMDSAKYQRDGDPRTSGPGFGLTTHEDVLTLPLRWRKPRRVFVNSMSDLFHKDVPDEFIARVFAVMAATSRHTYQVLTKRHGRMRSLLRDAESNGFRDAVAAELARIHQVGGIVQWPLFNVWLGVSVEDQKHADLRIPALLDTPAAVRFLSCEPLLGYVNLGLGIPASVAEQAAMREIWPDGLPANSLNARFSREMAQRRAALHWAIVGGESGPGARPMNPEWAESLVDQCRAAGVAAFVKQMGSAWGSNHHDIDAFPEWLQVREYPEVAS